MGKDERVNKLENNSIEIKQVNMYDSGIYVCKLVADPVLNVTHTLIVQRKWNFHYAVNYIIITLSKNITYLVQPLKNGNVCYLAEFYKLIIKYLLFIEFSITM